MSDKSAIEWTDATWNPVRGCSRVSQGCVNCYAERVAARFSGEGLPYHGLARSTPSGPRWTGEVRFVEEKLFEPLGWKEPRRIFVNSMSDLFHEKLADEAIDAVFAVMAHEQRHTFQVLTKRPRRMLQYMKDCRRSDLARALYRTGLYPDGYDGPLFPWPPPNVWLGVSAENQETADERIPLLLQTPAAVRFVSAEPLLGHLNLEPYLHDSTCMDYESFDCICQEPREVHLDWVIVGGESGPGARPCDAKWVYELQRECEFANVPFFFKQWGEYVRGDEAPVETWRDLDANGHPLSGVYRVGKKRAGRELDGRTWDEFPQSA